MTEDGHEPPEQTERASSPSSAASEPADRPIPPRIDRPDLIVHLEGRRVRDRYRARWLRRLKGVTRDG